ncbi:hypothetical protein SCUCBS95973_003177 [Sporothrix curviconia]|uniref:C2H2-type domain-containing protein n=1 Tax=Sporothrix curviconia TaxID=1260050 RepID=A0ABP0BD10_9PEZI
MLAVSLTSSRSGGTRCWQVSSGGRMLVIGDAEHAFLLTLGQGTAQVTEDAAAMAICFELTGKDNIPLALHTLQALRYHRASLVQQIGFETRNHQAYAYKEFQAAADTVRQNTDGIGTIDDQTSGMPEMATDAADGGSIEAVPTRKGEQHVCHICHKKFTRAEHVQRHVMARTL